MALAGVAQWIEHGPANQRVAGSIPSQGTFLGCRPGPQLGAWEGQPHIDISLPLSFPSLFSTYIHTYIHTYIKSLKENPKNKTKKFKPLK